MWRGTYREFHFSIYTIDEKLYGEKSCALFFHLCVVTIDFCLTYLYIQKCSVTRFEIKIRSMPMMAYFDEKKYPSEFQLQCIYYAMDKITLFLIRLQYIPSNPVTYNLGTSMPRNFRI